MKNIDEELVKDFGNEWDKYKQDYSLEELKVLMNTSIYFQKSTVKNLSDLMGSGGGRWARIVSPLVKELTCIEPSKKAINVSKFNLRNQKNCKFENASINDCSIKENSQDFGYCLGVLHHIPDTKAALNALVKLKKGSPLLIYIYYNFENKPLWYKLIWKLSDYAERLCSFLSK